MPPAQGELALELIHYETPECSTDFTLDLSNETLWATQQQIADAFGISPSTVRGHLQNIFKEGELDQSTVARPFRATASDGRVYNYLQYSLDAVLSVGYRVSSRRATAFRRWATQTLKDYIVQGFALDEQRLRDDPNALRELAARVRALRSDEKTIYSAVRDVFAFGSTDYDSNSQSARSFFAKLQDKFLYAVTGNTASQIILDRADHRQLNMDLVPDELYSLHILCEQFLLFVESKAIRGQTLTMIEMSQKFDQLIKLQGHPVFTEYKDYLVQKAKTHAVKELEYYRNRLTNERRQQAQIATASLPP